MGFGLRDGVIKWDNEVIVVPAATSVKVESDNRSSVAETFSNFSLDIFFIWPSNLGVICKQFGEAGL